MTNATELDLNKRPDTDDYEALFLTDTPMFDTRAPIEFKKGAFPHVKAYR